MKPFEQVIHGISQDNALPVKPKKDWPKFINEDYVNEAMSRMTEEELYTFSCGEQSEIEDLVQKYELHDISDLFNYIFDGDLSDFYFDLGFIWPEPPQGYTTMETGE
jgi:hypothetical protein